jgi:hypothetical protein
VTAQEHAAIISGEKNPEKRAYSEFLYETGAAQSDAAEFTAENIDSENGLLVYHRKKLGPDSEPARLSIGRKLRSRIASAGELFEVTVKTGGRNQRLEDARRPRERCRPRQTRRVYSADRENAKGFDREFILIGFLFEATAQH